MTIRMRPCRGEADFPLISQLLEEMPPATRHLVDLPWRMSSPALQSGQDAFVWEDSSGKILGFAAWQIYWATLDYIVRPGPGREDIEAELLAWALTRFEALDQQRGMPLPYWIEFRDDDGERKATAERYGYVLDDDFSYVQFSRPLSTELPHVEVPAGFTIRPFGGPSEVEAYVALHRAAFESTSMTTAWRARTLRTPQYRPALDLVAVAPDGTLAGFCIGWLHAQRRLAQIEPLGIHPHFQRLGLGHALLAEALERFKSHNAQYALVETESDRSPAQQVYQAVGFSPAHHIVRKGRFVSTEES